MAGRAPEPQSCHKHEHYQKGLSYADLPARRGQSSSNVPSQAVFGKDLVCEQMPQEHGLYVRRGRSFPATIATEVQATEEAGGVSASGHEELIQIESERLLQLLEGCGKEKQAIPVVHLLTCGKNVALRLHEMPTKVVKRLIHPCRGIRRVHGIRVGPAKYVLMVGRR
jgi:hypothetical protein